MLTEMNYDYARAVIESERQNGNKEFLVTMQNGEKKNMRLFVSADGQIGYHPPRTRRHGYLLRLEYVQSIEPVNRKETPIEEKFKKHARKLAEILKSSGLWANILKALEDCDFDYEKAKSDNYLGSDLVYGIANWKVKRMDFRHKYQHYKPLAEFNADYYEKIEDGYKQDKEFSIERIEGRSYDVSFSFKKCDDGIRRAWYSEEYRNCGNGHYYLAIDNERAIFSEND